MKRFLNIIKKAIMWFLGFMLLFVIGVVIFVNTAPQFGQAPQGKDLERIKQSPNYKDSKFINKQLTQMGSFSQMMKTMPDFLFGKNLSPKYTLPVKYQHSNEVEADSICYVTWYGHSAFLLELEGKRILIDPMLSKSPTPMGFGSSRFFNKEAIPIDELSNIDFLIISHDHYDHLDHQSILKLKDKVGHFFTALGIGSHLKKWGIPEGKITELDWWQRKEVDGLTFGACPARHFSGRGILDRDKTQWASWVIKSEFQNIYFSGDGGYGPHFKEIGEKYGPFDFAMLECGQYNEAWKDIHMMPEESVQAGIDVKANLIMPIHWGAFPLSVHTWKDPVERFTNKAAAENVNFITPYIGERFKLGVDLPKEQWWVGKN